MLKMVNVISMIEYIIEKSDKKESYYDIINKGICEIASKKNNEEISKLFAKSFKDYPLFTYYFPEDQNRLKNLELLHESIICYNLKNGKVYLYEENDKIVGCLISINLNGWNINKIDMISCGAIKIPFKLGIKFLSKQSDIEKVMDTTHKNIIKNNLHSYLWAIAVDPDYQNRGIGKKLINYYLNENKSLPIYLETSDLKNVKIYKKLGFKLVHTDIIQLETSKIKNYAMIKDSIISKKTDRDKSCSEIPYIIFHSIREHDLDKIISTMKISGDKQVYLIGASLGITKLPKIITKFGNIVLLCDKEVIKKHRLNIYERDSWTPTIRSLPDELYVFKPTKFAKEWFSRIDYLEEDIKKYGEENVYDPIKSAYDHILNESGYYSIFTEEIKNDKKLSKKYFDGEYYDYYPLLEEIIENCWIKIEYTRERMEQMLQQMFENDEKGQDGFAYAYAYASPLFSYTELDDRADKKLVCENDTIDFEQIKKDQWKSLDKFRGIERLEGIIEYKDVQLVGGLTMKSKFKKGITFEEFKRNLRNEFFADPNQADKDLRTKFGENYGLEDLYNELKRVLIDIKSEYFEAKTLKSIPINDFHTIKLPKGRNDLRNILINKAKFEGKIIFY